MQTHLLFQHGKIGNESKDITVPHGAFGYIGHNECVHTYVVVIPTRPTGGNIEAFTRTVALVKENADCPIIIAVNGVNRFTASVSFMEWLQKYRQKETLDLVMSIPQSEAIVQAENYSCSVNEINKYCPATQAVNTLCDKISQLAGLPVEKRQLKSKKLIAK